MDPGARHERLGALFLGALRLPADARDDWLAQAAAGDTALLAEVRALLVHDDPEGPFLEAGAVPRVARETRAAVAPDRAARAAQVPAGVPGYDLIEPIGSGGTATVFRAVQHGTRREVALKLLRPGLAHERVLTRLAREAEIQAQLDHPGIARVFAAGTWQGPTGELPYLVMELVRGRRVTDWADEAGLDVRGRVALLDRVASAVEHAHNRGVIHRDLKSDNILVTDAGQPKVLDFGVARILDDGDTAGQRATQPGQLLGTLAWMSPEQARADGSVVDARADVHALGLLAFRLLAGRMPFDTAGLPTLAVLSRVAEERPPLLGQLDRRLSGDLETIVDRCLRMRPEDRYASVAQLRADLSHHLAGEPIVARPPTAWEQLRRLAREHRLATAATVFVLMGVVAWGLLEARAAAGVRERAEHERRLTRILAGFLGAEATRSFDEILAWTERNLADDPGLRGRVLGFLGSAEGRLSAAHDRPRAVEAPLLDQAAALLEAEYGPDDDRTLEVAAYRAALAVNEGGVEAQGRDARKDRELLERVLAVFPSSDPVTLTAELALARLDTDTERSSRRLLAVFERAWRELGAASPLCRNAWIQICRRDARVLPPGHVTRFLDELPDATTRVVLATRWANALLEPPVRRPLPIDLVALLEPLHADVGGPMRDQLERMLGEPLARALVLAGRTDEALCRIGEVLEAELAEPRRDRALRRLHTSLAEVLTAAGDTAQALAVCELAMHLPVEGERVGWLAFEPRIDRALILDRLGEAARAEADLLGCVAALPEDTDLAVRVNRVLADRYRRGGDFGRAAALDAVRALRP